MTARKPLLVALCVLLLAGAAIAERPAKQLEPPKGWTVKPEKLRTLKAAPNGVKIDFCIVPGQWKGGALWSSWGDSVYASDGNFYTSVGDHHAPHGHAFIYKVDAKARTVSLAVDFTKALGVTDEKKYTPGKIHGPLIDGGDGWLYFAGYRGAEKYTTDAQDYDGDHLMRYDLKTGQVENLGVLVPETSHPAYRLLEATGTLYGLTEPGLDIGGRATGAQTFFVYDMKGRKLKFNGALKPNMARALILTDDGRVYYSSNINDKRVIVKYDPKTNKVTPTKAVVPDDGIMRAASRVTSKGVAYGISKSNGEIFAFDTSTETLKVISNVRVWGDGGSGSMNGYTAVACLDPKERFLYCVPRAHGGAEQVGSPAVQVDVTTGKRKAIAQFDPILRKECGYVPMGSFGYALSDDGSMLLINWNGCYTDWKTGAGRKHSYQDSRKEFMFDVCALTVLHIPEGLR